MGLDPAPTTNVGDLDELRQEIERLREDLDQRHRVYVAALRALNRALDQEWAARQATVQGGDGG